MMNEYSKIFHIYVKNKCIYHSLNESEFKKTWEMIHNYLRLVDCENQKQELSYEELIISKEIILNSSY